MKPAEKPEDRRDTPYELVAERLGLPTAQRLSEHSPATRLINCPSCSAPIRVSDIAPLRAVLRERLARSAVVPPP